MRFCYIVTLAVNCFFSFGQKQLHMSNVTDIDSSLSIPEPLVNKFLNYKLILIGEMHGTSEPAKFLVQLATKLSERKKIIVGYEIPGYQLTLPRKQFTEENLLKQKCFGHNTDGRCSTSWFESMLKLSSLPNIDFLFFDVTISQDGFQRDSAMFMNIRNKFLQDTSALIITLSGNIHNKLMPHKNIKTTAYYLVNYLTPHILSINHHYNSGTMYNNFGDGLKTNHVQNEGGVYKTLSNSPNYLYFFGKDDNWYPWNCILYTEKINASFPVKNK